MTDETDMMNKSERFSIRDMDGAIVDSFHEVADILLAIVTKTNGKTVDDYCTNESLNELLNYYENRLDEYELKEVMSWQTIYDNLINVERKLIILEKIVKEVDYIARTNFKVNENDYTRERERQFLIGMHEYYNHLFNEAYDSINTIKKEMK